jgi:predicted AAA+ superfamily ATPase
VAERSVRSELFFWRTHAGAEVDLLVQDGQRIIPIEIKLGAAVDHRAVAGLRQCMKDLGLRKGWVVCSGGARRMIGGAIEVVRWSDVVDGAVDFGFGRRR